MNATPVMLSLNAHRPLVRTTPHSNNQDHRQEKQLGTAFTLFGVAFSEMVVILVLSVLMVYLVLAAQYESWILPLAVILVVPLGVLGVVAASAIRGIENNVYTQVALIMLIGLAAKNAILIVQFARLAHVRGQAAVQAALDAARLRIRPILMTSFAFILGTLPLALAIGAGAGARRSIGTAVVFGMLAATVVGIFFIPSFYVLLQRIGERRWPFAARAPRPPAGSIPGSD